MNQDIIKKTLGESTKPNPAQNYIWLIGKALELKSGFFESLKKLLAEYDIEGKVFACSEHGLTDLNEGYLYIPEGAAETTDPETLRTDFNIFENAIYIENNRLRQGIYYPELSKIPQEPGLVLDLRNHKIL